MIMIHIFLVFVLILTQSLSKRLHILTCETRKSKALSYWTITATAIKEDNNHKVLINNLCHDKVWNGHGSLIMKITVVKEYLIKLKYSNSNGSDGNDDDIILFTDGGDSYFNTLSASSIINTYYNIIHSSSSSSNSSSSGSVASGTGSGSASIVTSGELTCWLGHICTLQEANLIYPTTTTTITNTTARYMNSGSYIGTVNDLISFLAGKSNMMI